MPTTQEWDEVLSYLQQEMDGAGDRNEWEDAQAGRLDRFSLIGMEFISGFGPHQVIDFGDGPEARAMRVYRR